MPARKPKTKATKKAAMKTTMGEYAKGELHSGSKHGPKVKSRKQAIAIGMHEAGEGRQAKAARRKRLEGKSV